MSSPDPPTSSQTIVSKTAPSTTHLDPGATLANRYRIISHLGKGGMGEVYRADDLTLGVSVALKFLPPSLAQDPLRLEHFRSEVRLARQVSHPNVCRVYDIGESTNESGGAGGPPRIFISMEYVDGEDLASLLRRIGRLPPDKAVQIARQLCFGLAAAHEQGIIHRDLKPANVMLDGRGQSRIMDFGIAGLSSDLSKPSAIAGTPGYMSPEQLSGNEVTKRSDIYSLGVLLYELFTGRAAFTATAIEELRTQQSKSSTNLTRPSVFIADIDPAVERVILQCLEPDPKDRPPSAMSIAAALPGGDPLAAALAAGETPSPELIAASGASQSLSQVQAWGRAALIVALLAVAVLVTTSWSMVSLVKPAKSPTVLEDRAAEIIKALGYTNPPADTVRSLGLRSAFVSYVNREESITNKVDRLKARPGPYDFWYRSSPSPISATSNDGRVQYQNPFPSQAGEILLRLDAFGRLETFLALPSRTRSTPPAETPEASIKRLFEFADLDQSRFTPAPPTLRSFIPTESVRSWTGTIPESPDIPLRIHVGSVEGKVNTFSIQYEYPQPNPSATQAAPGTPDWQQRLSKAINYGVENGAPIVLVLILIGTCHLAWRNLRTTRGDRTTAVRLSAAMAVLVLIALFFAHHSLPSARSLFFDGDGVSPAIFTAVEFWLFYTALEPYARRVYPHALVTWTRIARGGFNDALVGRHILIGLLLGSASVLCTTLLAGGFRVLMQDSFAISVFGRTGALLTGPSGVAASTASAIVTAILVGTGTMLPLVIGQLVFKRRWVGYVILVIGLAAITGQGLVLNRVDSLIGIAISMIPVLSIRSGGLLALVTTHLTIYLGLSLHSGLDWSHWFTAPTLIPASLLAALLFFSAKAACGGRTFLN